MLHHSFTSIQRHEDGSVDFKLERLGRCVLGLWGWQFLAELREPMLPHERAAWVAFVKGSAAAPIDEYSPAWASAVRRDAPMRAIRAYAEARRSRGEDVDVNAALGALKRASLMGEGPWN